jgi:putative alpha-1,2-mannosidase
MGSISALLAMGLFQFDGGSGLNPQYDITAPVFNKVTIKLSDKYYGGRTLTITAKNQGAESVYIKSAKWNGKDWNSSLLPHAELVKGGTLELELDSQPNKKWGAD